MTEENITLRKKWIKASKGSIIKIISGTHRLMYEWAPISETEPLESHSKFYVSKDTDDLDVAVPIEAGRWIRYPISRGELKTTIWKP